LQRQQFLCKYSESTASEQHSSRVLIPAGKFNNINMPGCMIRAAYFFQFFLIIFKFNTMKKLLSNEFLKTFCWSILLVCLAFMPSCKKDDDDNNNNNNNNNGGSNGEAEVIYLQTNDPAGNAILAYRHTGDGNLTQISGSPFSTGGNGVGNPNQVLGPDDSDQQLFLTADHKFLLTVNAGSNSIAVFNVSGDGSLSAVAGSPFPSGGETPVSVYVSENYVYVVNKSQNPLVPVTTDPNYTVFTLASNGALTPVAGSAVATTPGSSPAQALISVDKKFLFGADFLGFQLMPAVGTLRSFTVDSGGMITPVAGTPYMIPGMGGALGLWQHPSANVLYVGFPLQAKVGIYNINTASGALTFLSTVNAGPAACWLRTTKSGNYLYSLNSGNNSITAYNSSSATTPVIIDSIALKLPGPIYMNMGLPFTSSEGFAFDISPTNKYMYVVSQHTNPDFSIGNYNYLHFLTIGTNGTLDEPGAPIQLPVPNTVRPQGMVVFKTI
jgi:6-phosphogluconolactonase (cycloisomerase 2 family)